MILIIAEVDSKLLHYQVANPKITRDNYKTGGASELKSCGCSTLLCSHRAVFEALSDDSQKKSNKPQQDYLEREQEKEQKMGSKSEFFRKGLGITCGWIRRSSRTER